MNALSAIGLIVLLSAPANDEAFRAGVRPTEPLTAEEQQKTFHLPDGFEIQLFASEPDIQKPMNLAFDARGRLWMSGSVEYPYAAEGKGRDAIKILEDTDGDGRADKITTFLDDLNIPIGLYPYRDGVVAYSMPNIWFFRDTDGDDRSDTREILYGPLGQPRDTHGMQNAFRRGFDGWLYVNHGFANETTISAKDGSSIRLQSGNTYRIRLDGSRVEQFTWGQVNPFGSVLLPDGDMITADCHSKPLTLLLRGGYYSSFGKPHDGLGFVPDLMSHDHGSTAICGVVQLSGSHLPPEWLGQLLVGNVMTSRVNRDELRYSGSSPRAVEKKDFIGTDDPWFRPVDLQIGPDGALYIADFYNRIIGHYEVPLEHPGRDKHRARIWRVTYRGKDRSKSQPVTNFAAADIKQLIQALGSEHITGRMLATDQLTDRIGLPAVPALLHAAQSNPSELVRVHALWSLHRLHRLPAELLTEAATDSQELVRIHAQRILAETQEWTDAMVAFAKSGLRDESPRVQRAAASAVGRHGSAMVRETLAALNRAPAQDPFLRHALKIAVRDQLSANGSWEAIKSDDIAVETRELLADVALGVPTNESAEFLFDHVRKERKPRRLQDRVTHLVLHLPEKRVVELVPWLKQTLDGNADLQSKLLFVLHQRLTQRGIEVLPEVRDWGLGLCQRLLSDSKETDRLWISQSGDNPWALEPRRSEDGKSTVFLSSLPGGERKVGVLRSRAFVIPPKLNFYLCGHLGFPDKPAVQKNLVRLRIAETDEIAATAFPPRNDTARHITWDLGSHAGKMGYFEIVDQIDLDAYAWLAVARFDPPVVEVPESAPSSIVERQVSAAQLAALLQLSELRPTLLQLAGQAGADWKVRQAALRAYLVGQNRPLLEAAASMLAESALDPQLRKAITAAVAADAKEDKNVLVRVMQVASTREQRSIADSLASTPAGGETLLEFMDRGYATKRLLQDPAIRQKLLNSGLPEIEDRIDKITASLPPLNLEILKLIDERRRLVQDGIADPARGKSLFEKHCATCHQVQGQGALVGPQLDGIGNRGLERVIEDVLDPNRNVDANFHVSVLTLNDGRVLTGLVRRQEGQNLILADQQGKEIVIPLADIDERMQTPASLMPANVDELLKPDEFRDLMGFLLILRARSEPVESTGGESEPGK